VNAEDRSQLLQLLHERRDAIADRWHQAIARTDSVALDPPDLRQRLVELTDRVLGLLLAEPFDHVEAHAIGAALARLDSPRPEALGRTQEVLARQLLEALPAQQAIALQPRLAALLGGLATGFFRQACDELRTEQEQIQRALAAELWRSGQALRDSEETAWALLNAPSDPMLLLEPDGTIVDLNEAAAHGLGGSRDELIGASALDMFPPEVTQRRRAEGEQVLSSGQPVRFEDQRGGKWFDQNVYPIFDAHGEAVRLAVIARDVTERRRAEQRLRESEAQAWALLNAPVDPMLLLDPDVTIVDLNEAAAERLGKSRDELIGVCALDMFPPDVAELRGARLEQVVLSGQRVRFEDRRAGRWFDQSVYPICDAHGEVVRVAVIARDVSERKCIEEALRESELRYRTFFESVPVGVGVATADGRVLTCNDAMVEMTGYSREEFSQINLVDTYKDPDARAHLLDRLQADGSIRGFEVELVRRDGVPYWASLTITPLTMDGEDVVLTLAQDITEHKQMERHLLLTARLAAVGRFAAGLAHEINNPLQAIRSNLDMVLDFELEPDECQGRLNVVRQQIEDLVETTRQILGIAQPGDDTRYPVNIADVVQRALTLVGKQLRQAHVRVTTEFPADLPRVMVAPKQIGQVLLNLTVNAIEAMPEGGHLHLAARVDGDMVALAVSNDGPSVPAEQIDHVFDAFFTTKPEGNGLGLTISYRIVEQHGGTIRVANLGDDRGVVFTVMLPMAHLAQQQERFA
jgi:two-component system sporulation sensor kinase A